MSVNPFTGGLGGSAGGAFNRLEHALSASNLSPDAKAKVDADMQEVREEIVAFRKDKIFYRIVVAILGLAILFVIGGITALIAYDKDNFDALTAIGSAAVGGLVGLLAPSPVGGK